LNARCGAVRLGHAAGYRVLESEQLLGALAHRDVTTDTAVAFETAGLVEHRLAADG
jgi:hypothetical protein